VKFVFHVRFLPLDYGYNSPEAAWIEDIARAMLDELPPPPRRVMELGCGNGYVARLLRDRGYDVTAVDPSESGIAIARQFESDRLRFHIASTSEDLAARFGTFQVVISLEVIEHCLSANEFLSRFAAMLEPDGVGVISTPYHGYLKNLALAVSGRFDRHFDPLWEGGHVRFFSIATMTRLCEAHGLTPSFRRVGRIPPLAKSMIVTVKRRS
jgi:2-polyprenyl-3-methyl-5-hydroxy-6-metoxy-1,4-benzoquinol methylase